VSNKPCLQSGITGQISASPEHKGKIHPRTGYEGPEGEKRYSCTLSLTLALDGGRLSTTRPSHFTPKKYTAPIVYETPTRI